MLIPNDFDLPSLEAAIRERLKRPLPGAEAQLRFSPVPARDAWDPAARPAHARQAAALLLLYPGALGPSLALTERHADLPHHGGQISLPGGRIHDDESATDAALREAHEEIGVNPSDVRVIGELSSLWVLVSRFVVHPIIAIADRQPRFVPSPREVETMIEMPIAVLSDPTRLRWQHRMRRMADGTSVPVHVPCFALDESESGPPVWDATARALHVWGATAMILGEFGALLDPAFGPGPAPVPPALPPLSNSG